MVRASSRGSLSTCELEAEPGQRPQQPELAEPRLRISLSHVLPPAQSEMTMLTDAAREPWTLATTTFLEPARNAEAMSSFVV